MSIKSISDKLSINNLLPDYKINKKIFRGVLILFFIYCVFAWVGSGSPSLNETYAYAECSSDSFGVCINPFYDTCNYESNNYNVDSVVCNRIPDNYYKDQFLLVGESIGEKPPFLLVICFDVFYILVISAFFTNHFLYNKGYFKKKFWGKKNE